MKNTPPPSFNDEKLADFKLRIDASLILWGGGLSNANPNPHPSFSNAVNFLLKSLFNSTPEPSLNYRWY